MRRQALTTAAALVSVLVTWPAFGAALHRGQATFYEPTPVGACGRPQSSLHTAVNPDDFRGSSLCGAFLKVRGPGAGAVIVEVTNLCPTCPSGGLDLSPAAFDRLGARSEGRIPISWQVVAGPVKGPITMQIKDGSNPYWFAIQVRNHRYPIKVLEARRGVKWRQLGRTDYGYFVARGGLGSGPFSLRITDTRGHRIVERGVPLRPGIAVLGRGQFPR